MQRHAARAPAQRRHGAIRAASPTPERSFGCCSPRAGSLCSATNESADPVPLGAHTDPTADAGPSRRPEAATTCSQRAPSATMAVRARRHDGASDVVLVQTHAPQQRALCLWDGYCIYVSQRMVCMPQARLGPTRGPRAAGHEDAKFGQESASPCRYQTQLYCTRPHGTRQTPRDTRDRESLHVRDAVPRPGSTLSRPPSPAGRSSSLFRVLPRTPVAPARGSRLTSSVRRRPSRRRPRSARAARARAPQRSAGRCSTSPPAGGSPSPGSRRPRTARCRT